MEHQIKTQLLIVALAAGTFSACSDYFDKNQLHNDGMVKDVRTDMVYELTEADYQWIAKDTITNRPKAEALGTAAVTAWQAIGTDKAFSDAASPDIYIPALMQQKFPYLDNGTLCEVTYTFHEGKGNHVQPFLTAKGYTLQTTDYETIWGKRGADYITPSTVDNIFSFLNLLLPSAPVGKIVHLTYNYYEEEPDPSELTDFFPYRVGLSTFLTYPDAYEHEFTGIMGTSTFESRLAGMCYLVDGNDSIKVTEVTDENGKKVLKDNNLIHDGDSMIIRGKYTYGDEPKIEKGIYIAASVAPAPRRVQTLVKGQVINQLYVLSENGWTLYANHIVKVAEPLPQEIYDIANVTEISDLTIIETYLKQTYPYAAKDDIFLIAYKTATGATADEWTYNGTEFVLTSGYIEETMSFEVKNSAWIANTTTYLQTKFVGEGLGKFTIQHVNLDGLNYVWRYQAAYGATASAYVSTVNHRVEDWLISPKIKMKKAVSPQLAYDNAVRYGNTTDNTTWLSVMVTDNFTGDVTTTEWQKLPFPAELPDGSNWIFRTSGYFDLSEYAGKNIYIAFRYKTDFDGLDVPSAPTWELQNLLVAEPEVFAEKEQANAQ